MDIDLSVPETALKGVSDDLKDGNGIVQLFHQSSLELTEERTEGPIPQSNLQYLAR